MKQYRDYRDYLRMKRIKPLRIERTNKQAGDLVLHSWAKPVERAL